MTAESPVINKLMDAVQADVSREQAKFEKKKLDYDTLRREQAEWIRIERVGAAEPAEVVG